MEHKKFNFGKKLNKTNKLVCLLVLFVISFCICIFSFINTFINPIEDSLIGKEKSSSSYFVKLKENTFYEEERLPEGMNYVSSLIDKIELTFDYLFSSNELVDYDCEYTIDAITNIYGEDGESIVFSKSEQLFKSKKISKKDIADYNFKKTIDIDYEHFNKLANKFKTSYYITSDSDLTIVLNVKSTGKNKKYDDKIILDSNSLVKIPLTEKTVKISINSNNIDNTKLVSKKNVDFYNAYVVLFIISICLSLLFGYLLVRFIINNYKKKTRYELMLNKILKENDSIIANVNQNINFFDYEVIGMSSFEELRDIHDNNGNPILYNEFLRGKEAYFYIVDDKIVYRYILSSNVMNSIGVDDNEKEII